jgi:tetratricopeptide (TPR) repeat protein
MSYDYGNSGGYDAGITESYNNGNGFTPLAGTNRGGVLFQNSSKSPNPNATSQSSAHRKDYNNGGAAAGRSCLVVPTFGSQKKKKKKEKVSSKNKTSPTRTPKNRNGALFGGKTPTSGDSVSTSAESSMPDPYMSHNSYNDKKSLLKSFNKTKNAGNEEMRDWYLETMVEEDEDGSNSNLNNRPSQFVAQQQQQQRSRSQFTPPQRENMGNGAQNYTATNSAPPTNVIPNFLSMPKAEDRSHQARSRQQKMHAYQGELEPEGVRGQEANVIDNSPQYEVQQSSPHLSNNKQQPTLRDFTSPTSESSSQLLPIHEVVSNRQRQIQNSLLGNHETEAEYEENPDRRTRKSPAIQTRPSPGYKERMTVASSVLGSGQLRQEKNIYNGYDEDVEYEEMVSQNRAEFEREYNQQHDSRQPSQRLQSLQQQQLRQRKKSASSNNSRNDTSIGSASKSSRRSAPVNIDDASFENPLEHIQGIHALAMEHVEQGEFDMALQAFKQVLKVYIEEHGEAHPLTASAYHNLGTVHTKCAGELPENTLHQRHCREKALQCFQAAARSARDCPTLGPNHPNVAVSLVRIGFLLLQSRQYKNAVITFKEALRIRTENYGFNHGLVANLFNNLGVCHMHLQEFFEGQKHLQQALDIQKELLIQEGDDSNTANLELADTLCNIGGLNLEWIRRQGPDARHALDAESAFVEAIELRTNVLGENHALTNQVQSLFDMVRSLPMPTTIAKSKDKEAGNNRVPSWSPARSSNPDKMNTFGGEFSPAAISDITNSVKQSNHDRSTRSTESVNESVDMSIPAMQLSTGEPFFPQKRSTPLPDRDNRNAANPNFMDAYDATEESCLLRRPIDDEQSASQAGGFVTYARSTVSNGSESNHNESNRAATMRQAKDVLDSHQDFMYSPNRNNKGEEMERTIDERDGNAYEDGLIPLAGNWPGPRNISRLSPDCLQNPSENLHTIHNCAVSYMARGRYTEAVALLEMIVECQKEKNGSLHANVGSAVHNVGISYLRSEVYYKAFQSFEEAVRVRKAALGREHPEVAVSLVKFGISLMLLQRHEDSLWIFRDALSIRKQALGDLHPSNARIYNNIGCVHVELGEFEEARKDFESALDIQRNELIRNSENGPMIFGASTTLQNLGYLYGKRGLHEKAAMVLRESLSVSQNK